MSGSNSPVGLEAIAEYLAAPGKGLLASDESTGTIGKRLEKANLENTEDIRRRYRQLYYTAPGLGQYISGAIMFKETLGQSADNGQTFVECLRQQGILPGIKVDDGLAPLPGGLEGETQTKGLEGLAKAVADYASAGARFAKWRATLKIDDGRPSVAAIELNAKQLAEYAVVCQAAGIVPVIEPEILIDGAHDILRAREVSEQVLSGCVAQLWAQGVKLEGCLLKPQMAVPGADFAGPKPSPHDVAVHTLDSLRRTIPAAIPGIMFLSGGQTEEEATVNLNAINLHAQQVGRAPWALTFSFGRALQASVLKHWSEDTVANTGSAQQLAVAVAAANSAASRGKYEGPHPCAASEVAHLRETFRGWRADAPTGAAAGGAVPATAEEPTDACTMQLSLSL